MPLALWLAEYALEVWGASRAIRRGVIPLAVYLSFCCISEPILFWFYRNHSYIWADYINRCIQYPLFIWLAVYLCSKMLWDDKWTVRDYCLNLSAFAGLGVIWWHLAFKLNLKSATELESAVMLSCAMLVGFAAFRGKGPQWNYLAYPFLLLTVSDGILAILQGHRLFWVTNLYPLGAIPSLVWWVRNLKPEPDSVSLELPPKIPVTCVGQADIPQRRVM